MRLPTLLLPVAVSLAFAKKSEGVRYPMTEAMIAGFLRANGIAVTSSQVHLPTKVTAITRDPQLEITASRRLSKSEVRLELHCQSAGACLPFDVFVDAADVNAITRTVETERQSDSSVDGAWVNSNTGEKTLDPRVGDPSPAHLRVGAQVVLVIEDGNMQIHLPAIAMDSGSAGSVVRVCTLNRKKMFRAQVVNDEVVKEVIE